MRLRPEQLEGHLGSDLRPIYVVTGDEHLLVGECADAIRTAARRQGFGEREVMHAEAGFDWNSLGAAADSLSLFAERRIIDLRVPSGKPGDVGGKALAAYAERPSGDNLLLLTLPKLDKRQQQSKWFKSLEAAGAVIQVWPVAPNELPGWLMRRMRSRGLEPDQEAARRLAERVEGNLLAAAQEVEKLLLLLGEGPVDAAAVERAVADSARYDVFELADTALAGDPERAARVLQGLRGEGAEPVLVLWALAREIRTLAAISEAVAGGAPLERAMADQKVWAKRQPAVRSALSRHKAGRWQKFLVIAGRIDRTIKGAEPGNAWDELLQLALLMAGTRIL